jgi:predicted transcriptional regulator YdeE
MESASLSPVRVSLIVMAGLAALLTSGEVTLNPQDVTNPTAPNPTVQNPAVSNPAVQNPKIVQLQAFQVVGTWASTNNAKESGPDAIIGKQWQQFIGEHLADKIPDRIDHDILAVYTDYTSDANGQYSFILGARVKPVVNPTVPEGMVVKSVPAGRYAVFSSERGPIPKIVIDTWKRIWAYYQSDQNGQRAYQADFEVYDQRAADPNNAQVDIYIGVK